MVQNIYINKKCKLFRNIVLVNKLVEKIIYKLKEEKKKSYNISQPLSFCVEFISMSIEFEFINLVLKVAYCLFIN